MERRPARPFSGVVYDGAFGENLDPEGSIHSKIKNNLYIT